MSSFSREPINMICPKCGNGNWMRLLSGENVGELNIKCFNCLSYFRSSDLYNTRKQDKYISVEIANKIIETLWRVMDTEWSEARNARQECFKLIEKNSVRIDEV